MEKIKSKRKTAFIASELLIDKSLYLILYSLLKAIFLKTANNHEKLNKGIDIINRKLIKSDHKCINNKFSKKNMENILDFIKSQNIVFAGDIFESMLIIIFSQVFEADNDETFGKYIYYNLSGISDETFTYFLNKDKFKEEIGIQNIYNILILEKYRTQNGENILNFEEPEYDVILYNQENQNEKVFKLLYILLKLIAQEKYK